MVEGFVAAIVVLLLLILASLSAVLYQLAKQQGRLLLRLDAVESRLRAGRTRSSPGDPPEGIHVGTPFPAFRLPDLNGRTMTGHSLPGRRTLLVHWNPRCGFCEVIAPELARLHRDFERNGVGVTLVSYGDADSNRALATKHGLGCPILLQDQSQTLEAFRGIGTPAAYLLDERRRVARPLIIGAEAVLDLAEDLVGEHAADRKRLPGERPLSESRILRDGVKAGTPAPSFRQAALDGRAVSPEDYRGRSLLLVFTDPDCGPCDSVAPAVARLHQERSPDVGVVVIGRGDPDANRRKARAHAFEFPVVVQQGWEISRQFGIFYTPVAFLIGEDGLIARNVARGPEEIAALVDELLRAGKEAGDGVAI